MWISACHSFLFSSSDFLCPYAALTHSSLCCQFSWNSTLLQITPNMKIIYFLLSSLEIQTWEQSHLTKGIHCQWKYLWPIRFFSRDVCDLERGSSNPNTKILSSNLMKKKKIKILFFFCLLLAEFPKPVWCLTFWSAFLSFPGSHSCFLSSPLTPQIL